MFHFLMQIEPKGCPNPQQVPCAYHKLPWNLNLGITKYYPNILIVFPPAKYKKTKKITVFAYFHNVGHNLVQNFHLSDSPTLSYFADF